MKSLTFESARDANKAPYPRRLMQTGAGSEANVLNEADLMTSNIPPSSESNDYLLGIGDQLLYTQLNEFMNSPTQFPTQPTEVDYLLGVGDQLLYTQLDEFMNSPAQFPTQPTEVDYLLGVGDELTLIQLNEVPGGLGNIISNIPQAGVDESNQNAAKPQSNENALKTSGLVGTNGNILLLGLGSIKAKGRSLSDVQTEVRNILIRNGLAPSFQLEITSFNSKKAFVTFPNPNKNLGNNIVSITNLPITLKELAITYGLRPSSKDSTIVSLTRDGQKFRMTAGQLFDKTSPRIVIKDRDQIEIDEAASTSTSIEAIVGSRGNILIPGVDSLKAKNRSLAEVQADITRILMDKGLTPNFQLEITSFNSKKAFVTFPNPNKNLGNNIVSITNLPITLKELAITYGLRPSSKDSTIVSLTRDGQKFRMTAGQLFDKTSPRIVIKDRDQIEIDEAASTSTSIEAIVGSRGNILIPGVGSLKAKNRSLTEVQADITHILMDKGLTPNFQLEVTGFESRKFFLVTEKSGTKAVPLTDTVVDLKDAVLSNIATEHQTISQGSATFKVVELIRNGVSYRMSWQKMLSGGTSNVLIQDGDTIKLKDFDYKLGQVFALGGAGNAELVPIDPSKRETLADILFSPKGALNNLLAKRSEVYLLRGRNPSVAYHLDAQNVSRILVAAQTELRPNDIVYVADRPIISFSRTLTELNPLNILLRDLQNVNIP
ncbi:hypothetical protein N9V59_02935 [Amylibacter sp.]|nr:hypothetical protein [Amylibacter sp.]